MTTIIDTTTTAARTQYLVSQNVGSKKAFKFRLFQTDPETRNDFTPPARYVLGIPDVVALKEKGHSRNHLTPLRNAPIIQPCWNFTWARRPWTIFPPDRVGVWLNRPAQAFHGMIIRLIITLTALRCTAEMMVIHRTIEPITLLQCNIGCHLTLASPSKVAFPRIHV